VQVLLLLLLLLLQYSKLLHLVQLLHLVRQVWFELRWGWLRRVVLGLVLLVWLMEWLVVRRVLCLVLRYRRWRDLLVVRMRDMRMRMSLLLLWLRWLLLRLMRVVWLVVRDVSLVLEWLSVRVLCLLLMMHRDRHRLKRNLGGVLLQRDLVLMLLRLVLRLLRCRRTMLMMHVVRLGSGRWWRNRQERRAMGLLNRLMLRLLLFLLLLVVVRRVLSGRWGVLR